MALHEEQGPTAGVTAHLTIRDNRATEAIAFYKAAFGATDAMPAHLAEDGKRVMHSHLKINGGSVMLNDDFPEYRGGPSPAPASVTLHIQTDDPDRLFEQAIAAGAIVTMPLANQFWGDRYGQVQDPFGHSWSIGGPSKD